MGGARLMRVTPPEGSRDWTLESEMVSNDTDWGGLVSSSSLNKKRIMSQ